MQASFSQCSHPGQFETGAPLPLNSPSPPGCKLSLLLACVTRNETKITDQSNPNMKNI